jgi:hypothetical protein
MGPPLRIRKSDSLVMDTASTASIGGLASVGGKARATSLSPERRREIAQRAAQARWRPRKAHQRIIRERAAQQDPREPLASLDGCTVAEVTRRDAARIILRYEWLGTMGRARVWYGLRAPHGELLGVVGFGGTAPQDLREAVVLERGACVHFAPRNAGSFLIRRAVRLAHREHGWSTFVAYADPDAGEIGTVYQACGWSYTGQGGRPNARKRDQFVRPDGRRVDERMLRHLGLKLADVPWRRVQTAAKHRYVWVEGGPQRPGLPYPKRPSVSQVR